MKPILSYPRRRSWLCLGAAGLLAACAAGPDFQAPPGPVVQQYTAGVQPLATVSSTGAGGAAQRFDAGMDIPAQWWTLFHSPQLDALVREALTSSPSMAQAKAALRQASENLGSQVGATRYPKVDLQLGGVRQQIDTAALGIPNVPQAGPFTLYNASLGVSYTVDAFGANTRMLEGLQAQVDNQAAELQAVQLTLAGNVVTAAIRQASLQAQLAGTGRMLQLQRQQLAIMQQRFAAGGIAERDLKNQRTLVAQSEAALPALQQQLAQASHQLAVYLGRTPAQADMQPLALDTLTLPDRLPLSLPSTLARQRPDIRAAEATLHQASAQVGVASANLYPQLTLSGSVGAEQGRIADLANSLNVWNIGLKLMQPLFHGGELRAKKRAAAAAYDAAAAGYQQTVLQALQQVADSLRALENDAEVLQARTKAAENARDSLAIASRQYQAGGVSHLSLLDAERQGLQTELDRIVAQAARYADTAALLQALGGGWWNAEPSAAR
ncbi:efflux transporter outer membrane subunit [Collimonas sp. OK412]|jgi:NodT family efflux transporter outer membrane factor (OMF) lipoprotein|uniref:efflux transporter outer membrane subunit n=1 Tax=Collimonas sp. (strain OK412) TaxID=1801619 RepID=UPI0008F1E003|nr:efflux transporter outer membrane subunit [Collimonas sp. OK412]SFC88574.1 efflux transporter, outer membrane factor (OMF) lipoprotein, NodT family [Collimonas sp. OK412]